MILYLAPLEGITGYIYRNAQYKYFGDIDKYFTPFISLKHKGKFGQKEINDILPEHNIDMNLVPQLLTNDAQLLLDACRYLKGQGYDEVNLNLGCPSGTVVSKGKGAGLLYDKEALDEFLYNIFENIDNKLSIKTRIGIDNPEEFYEILDIYNKYPMHELIIHPRTRKDFYKNKPNLDIFKYAINNSKNKICYNGDIFGLNDYIGFKANYNNQEDIMIGRGVITNPALPRLIKKSEDVKKEELINFHEYLLEEYSKVLSGDMPVLFKMKEMWFYMLNIFVDSEKFGKKIKKSKHISDYKIAVNNLFDNCDISTDFDI